MRHWRIYSNEQWRIGQSVAVQYYTTQILCVYDFKELGSEQSRERGESYLMIVVDPTPDKL